MGEGLANSIRKRMKTPKGQLEILRMLFAPIPIIAGLVYPWAMFGAIFSIGPGGDEAIRLAYLMLFGFTFYLIAVVFIGIKWSDWPLVSSILFVPVLIAHVAALVYEPFVATRIPLFPLGFLGINLPDTASTILGSILFGLIFLIVPMLSIWRLVRHAFDMDFPGSDRPVELWDLKSINSKR